MKLLEGGKYFLKRSYELCGCFALYRSFQHPSIHVSGQQTMNTHYVLWHLRIFSSPLTVCRQRSYCAPAVLHAFLLLQISNQVAFCYPLLIFSPVNPLHDCFNDIAGVFQIIRSNYFHFFSIMAWVSSSSHQASRSQYFVCSQ